MWEKTDSPKSNASSNNHCDFKEIFLRAETDFLQNKSSMTVVILPFLYDFFLNTSSA